MPGDRDRMRRTARMRSLRGHNLHVGCGVLFAAVAGRLRFISLSIVRGAQPRQKEEGTMGNSFPAGGFGGSAADGIWQAMEEFKTRFEKRVGTRMGRGDVRAAVLALLAEKPMHGYQIIHEIEERSGGSWKPSAG